MLIVNDNNSTCSIYYDAFDDGSNYFGKIITENTALQWGGRICNIQEGKVKKLSVKVVEYDRFTGKWQITTNEGTVIDLKIAKV